jgi:hypothetical protein
MDGPSDENLTKRLAFLKSSTLLYSSNNITSLRSEGLTLVHTESGKCIDVDQGTSILVLIECTSAILNLFKGKVWSGLKYDGIDRDSLNQVVHIPTGKCISQEKSSWKLKIVPCGTSNLLDFTASYDGLKMVVRGYIPEIPPKNILSTQYCLASNSEGFGLFVAECNDATISQWIVILGKGHVYDPDQINIINCNECTKQSSKNPFTRSFSSTSRRFSSSKSIGSEGVSFKYIDSKITNKGLIPDCWQCCLRNSIYCLGMS